VGVPLGPLGLGSKQCALALPLGKILPAPDVDELIQGADVGGPPADQSAAIMAADRQAEIFGEAKVFGSLAGDESVRANLMQHARWLGQGTLMTTLPIFLPVS